MQEGTISSRDGTELFYRTVGPEEATRHVLIVHGFGEHSGRYVELMNALANAGIASLAFDLRGHGRSHGDRGMIRSFEDYLDDTRAAHAKLGKGSDTLVLGHSMGGLIVLHLLALAPTLCRGLVLGSPYLGRALAVNPVKLAVGRLLGKVAPTVAIPTGLSGKHVTHDPKEVSAYDNDPLFVNKARTGWFVAIEEKMKQAPDVAVRLQMPLLWLHGESDPVASFAQSRAVYERAESRDKHFVAFAGMLHEPLHEIERTRVIQTITQWLLAH